MCFLCRTITTWATGDFQLLGPSPGAPSRMQEGQRPPSFSPQPRLVPARVGCIPHASCTPRAPGSSLNKQAQSELDSPSRLVLGKLVGQRKGSLAFQLCSYSSRSFCPKGSFDVQNRLWCQYECSIVGVGDRQCPRQTVYL